MSVGHGNGRGRAWGGVRDVAHLVEEEEGGEEEGGQDGEETEGERELLHNTAGGRRDKVSEGRGGRRCGEM